MCLIAVKPYGTDLPDKQKLKNGYEANKDGAGIAYWRKNKRIKIKKDFESFEDFYTYLAENIKKEDSVIIHFRLATHGLVDKGNRHPFPITKNKKRLRTLKLTCGQAVAHNGVIDGYKHKKFSDTQKFILDILADPKIKNNLKSKTIQKILSRYIDGDRLAILDSDGSIILLGEFIEDSGCLYSNRDFRRSIKVITGYKKWCAACYEVKKNVKFRKKYQEYLCKRCYKRWKKEGFKLEDVEDQLAEEEYEDDTEFFEEFEYECPKCRATLSGQNIAENHCSFCYEDLSKYVLSALQK
jgi:hypothetical protein